MFEWSETDEMIREAVRTFIDKEVRPHLDALDSGEMPPYPILRKLFADFGIEAMGAEAVAKMLAKQRKREEALAAGEELPEKKSAGGSSPFAGQESLMAVLIGELSGVCMGLVTALGVSIGLGATTIMSRGTLAQKERWLADIVTLKKVASWAITEPDSGSDAFGGMKTYVKRDGEDYILNGQKTFITNGPYADVMIVYAKLDEGDAGVDKRDRKVLTFVLDKGMEGLTQGKPFKKMGLHSSPTGELFFDNVRVGRDRLLGETEEHKGGDGRDSARSSFTAERVGVAFMALGIINECHRLCIDYAKNRKLWGQEIGRFQLVQLKLAKMEVARINVQNMVFSVLERGRAGKPPTLAEASAMKLYASEAATEVAMEAVQLFGGNGYMTEYRVEQLARDAKSLMIYAGSNEIQVTHVAKGLLA
ncbi:acyl-CoA dehydrogenase family protein [Nocardia cyriacigeorgica]|uniref:acyl-CoA dehydrogenase family protein n=1 Tax=Nocardia cyriacigeorgica TaxID=135487 RepID=UPI0018932FEC|nr:acyl-CoA dehydrogenase family protein [Nocardia cyriacigeorgica]MBF6083532.1 acyl-CoA dehydrogenase family protein [Nocardia cyriacigeorgica]MBF6289091.1 acyl-CoA dehydrogenase family protein [Nocardia cyriacigeorgica]MBF6425576.1 acyl-CoA dehydrogenase family protein [Nocardia cyriacigeorgica]BDT85214.1 putative acyl-CoA dehydrogenase FadE [Nocardia cyriacigeorgica]BDU04835.1 putative acyl-CoA dehydrogenase FadE [Nocardia cyriacigeorgica]